MKKCLVKSDKQIITITNVNTREYFFTTDHCQALSRDGEKFSDNWVPCTFTIPQWCSPRSGLEDGLIKDKETWKIVFGAGDSKEILNPDPEFQA